MHVFAIWFYWFVDFGSVCVCPECFCWGGSLLFGSWPSWSFMSSLYCHYMFGPNQPSLGVQVVVMKDYVAHYNAVLIF
jgi:hypothetical protein